MSSRGKDQFLADCDPDERAAFSEFFADVEELAKRLGDPEPTGDPETSTRTFTLRWAFEGRKGASLRLRHPKLSRGPATILWAFPSRNHDRMTAANGLYIHPGPLTEHGVKDEDAAAYGRQLLKADFEDVGEKTWRTATSGMSDGFSRIYRFDANRVALRAAIDSLVAPLNRY